MSRTIRSIFGLVLMFGLTILPLRAQEPSTPPPATPSELPTEKAPAAPQNASPDTTEPTGHDEASKRDAGAKPEKSAAAKAAEDKPLRADKVHNPILWQDPGDVSQRDLRYGQGGEKHQPKPPFTFIAEDKSGTNPKFDVRAADGKKWRVKLAEEARPEVVASRLLWAVGYFANDDYLVTSADVANLKISRGSLKGEHIVDARFSRKPGGQDKIATWEWKNNPFTGTREFNGLRVMMAVMNNWDLKDVNNSVYEDKDGDRQIFLVNDVGATFATNSVQTSRSKDKGNVDSFRNSKFITKKTDTTVSFATPAPPTGLLVKSAGFLAADYFKRKGMDWIGDDIPIQDVRWIGSLLGQLSHQQLMDAFHAANFPEDQVDTYVQIVENRIAELKQL